MSIKKSHIFLLLAISVTIPAAVLQSIGLLQISELHLTPGWAVLVFSSAIVGAAFLLSWAGEVAQKDISQGLALALVALVAVLPEYAVDFYLTWMAGQDPSGDYGQYATANMTGANRLLIGLGWPLVILVIWFRSKSQLNLDGALFLELTALTLATVYAFTIPFKSSIALWDGAVLIGVFSVYMWLSSKNETSEPDLIGPAAIIARVPSGLRKLIVIALFVFSALIILGSAEPFAEGLLQSGESLGVDEYLLVQWVAPLASESPEILIAVIFALKGEGSAAMTMLISSKVNQWTLLVGSLPFVYTISLGSIAVTGLDLDARQMDEIWLTAAQSLFAIVLLLKWKIGIFVALALFIPWVIQLGLVSPDARMIYAIVYVVMAIMLFLVDQERRANARQLAPQTVRLIRGG
ncbi:sodium:calcium antiporter [SAR202 cluster bacterium AD-802-E10_MRT_200m]|nr:sodium:calcium antiporter [SAR202 cluster bacterium AD-802-E10_MRT_200m]